MIVLFTSIFFITLFSFFKCGQINQANVLYSYYIIPTDLTKSDFEYSINALQGSTLEISPKPYKHGVEELTLDEMLRNAETEKIVQAKQQLVLSGENEMTESQLDRALKNEYYQATYGDVSINMLSAPNTADVTEEFSQVIEAQDLNKKSIFQKILDAGEDVVEPLLNKIHSNQTVESFIQRNAFNSNKYGAYTFMGYKQLKQNTLFRHRGIKNRLSHISVFSQSNSSHKITNLHYTSLLITHIILLMSSIFFSLYGLKLRLYFLLYVTFMLSFTLMFYLCSTFWTEGSFNPLFLIVGFSIKMTLIVLCFGFKQFHTSTMIAIQSKLLRLIWMLCVIFVASVITTFAYFFPLWIIALVWTGINDFILNNPMKAQLIFSTFLLLGIMNIVSFVVNMVVDPNLIQACIVSAFSTFNSFSILATILNQFMLFHRSPIILSPNNYFHYANALKINISSVAFIGLVIVFTLLTFNIQIQQQKMKTRSLASVLSVDKDYD